jgi:hypothetical protein
MSKNQNKSIALEITNNTSRKIRIVTVDSQGNEIIIGKIKPFKTGTISNILPALVTSYTIARRMGKRCVECTCICESITVKNVNTSMGNNILMFDPAVNDDLFINVLPSVTVNSLNRTIKNGCAPIKKIIVGMNDNNNGEIDVDRGMAVISYSNGAFKTKPSPFSLNHIRLGVHAYDAIVSSKANAPTDIPLEFTITLINPAGERFPDNNVKQVQNFPGAVVYEGQIPVDIITYSATLTIVKMNNSINNQTATLTLSLPRP